MEKKAKIIATLGPSIYSENKLKRLIELGVDAFRIILVIIQMELVK